MTDNGDSNQAFNITKRPFLIGERLNTQGSRQFKQVMLDDDREKILHIAQLQILQGAQGLDICTAMTEGPDELENMLRVIQVISGKVDAILVIDTTQPDVMEAALRSAAGACILNSTHLENGRSKADRVFELAKNFHAPVIALTIDEQGMAKTAAHKLAAAHQIYEIGVKDHGLQPGSLIFDALTFTLATADPQYENSAVETLEAISTIKRELPGAYTSLGVSNVSYGFPPDARILLNNIMLEQALQRGLDMVIFNPAHILDFDSIPDQERQLAEDLILNRSEDALRNLSLYFRQLRKKQALS
jgi:5-methyltetrahydrofolate--homocysteine methyltransferase